MVPLIINPIYTLYSGYLLGISPFKGLLGGLKQLGYHPKGTTIFPMIKRWTALYHMSGKILSVAVTQIIRGITYAQKLIIPRAQFSWLVLVWRALFEHVSLPIWPPLSLQLIFVMMHSTTSWAICGASVFFLCKEASCHKVWTSYWKLDRTDSQSKKDWLKWRNWWTTVIGFLCIR